MTLTVETVPHAAAADWDRFVRAAVGWTPYHLYGWRRVIERVHGHDCFYLGARATDGTLRGVLPLVRVQSVLFGHYLVSQPFVNYGGPLGDPDALVALAGEAMAMAARDAADLLELRSASELPLDMRASHRKITVVLDLPAGGPTVLWERLSGKVRSQVRRPMKEGVSVHFGPDQLEGFYNVLARHMRDLGTPVQPRGFFEKARHEFEDAMWFGCAYLDGQPIAAGCGFRWSDRFELVWASSLRQYSRIAPNMLLYWKFLERCAEDGASIFDFGRCTPNGGTHRFKLQWGGRDEPLWWYQHGAKAGGGTPSPDDGILSVGPKIWRRFPLALANRLGPLIVRYLP